MHSLRLTVKSAELLSEKMSAADIQEEMQGNTGSMPLHCRNGTGASGTVSRIFPSYGYLQQVKENYEQMYKPDEIIMGAEGGTPKLTAEQNLIVQLPSMKEQEKKIFCLI